MVNDTVDTTLYGACCARGSAHFLSTFGGMKYSYRDYFELGVGAEARTAAGGTAWFSSSLASYAKVKAISAAEVVAGGGGSAIPAATSGFQSFVPRDRFNATLRHSSQS